jgi:hypothetical protein
VAVQVARAAEHPNRGREWLERPRSRRPGTPAGLVLPAAALRPARHRRLRSIAARPAAAVGGVHRGTGRGHGRDRLAAGRAAGHGPQAGPLGLFFAGTRPERTSALILADATARYLAADDYPIGFSSEAAEATIARAEEPWGSEAYAGSVRRAGPATSGSCAGRPGSSGPSPAHGWSGPICGPCCRSTSAPILPLIQAPTLVLAHREFQQLPVEHGRYLGEHIAGARLVELPGDLPLWVRPNRSWVLGVVEEFLIGARHGVEPDRVLATVLFTDIVGSTQQAAELGDRASPGHVAEREASRRSGHVRNQRQRTAAPAHPSGVHHRRGGMHPGGSAHPFCPVAAG